MTCTTRYAGQPTTQAGKLLPQLELFDKVLIIEQQKMTTAIPWSYILFDVNNMIPQFSVCYRQNSIVNIDQVQIKVKFFYDWQKLPLTIPKSVIQHYIYKLK